MARIAAALQTTSHRATADAFRCALRAIWPGAYLFEGVAARCITRARCEPFQNRH
jgi:hypothetical protein